MLELPNDDSAARIVYCGHTTHEVGTYVGRNEMYVLDFHAHALHLLFALLWCPMVLPFTLKSNHAYHIPKWGPSWLFQAVMAMIAITPQSESSLSMVL